MESYMNYTPRIHQYTDIRPNIMLVEMRTSSVCIEEGGGD